MKLYLATLAIFALWWPKYGRNRRLSTITWNIDHLMSRAWCIHRLGESPEIIQFSCSTMLAKFRLSGGRKISTIGGFQPLFGILVVESTSYMVYILVRRGFTFLARWPNFGRLVAEKIAAVGFWPLYGILIIEYTSYWLVKFSEMIRFVGHTGQISALWWSNKLPKLVVYDNWPVS